MSKGMAGEAAPSILVFDSGVGGLTVYRAIRDGLPAAHFVYVADDAAFPYGRLNETALVARVMSVFEWLMPIHQPDAIVIACNTASTLVLPHLRARYGVPVVGTVPAIKTGAEQSRTGVFSVLATPGTISRDYTRRLITEFASGKHVELVGSATLAALAEQVLRGEPVDRKALAAEIAPCFVEVDGRRTDMIVLGCTHYPLLIEALREVSIWPVEWIDPAPAIAKRVVSLLGAEGRNASIGHALFPAIFTSGRFVPRELALALARFGLGADPDRSFAFAA
jgi:glutamate racemase